MTDQNLPAERPERGPDSMSLAASASIGFGGASGFDLAPKSLGEVVGFSKLMASAGHAIPNHLRGNPGACMAVTIQALGWQMSPFAVAQKSYKVGDTIAYEAQLISAVVNVRAGFKNRPLIEYQGEGPTRQCKVTFTFKNGDVRDYQSPMFKDIPIKNSPLWKNDPDQQLSYYSQRSAARRHCPEVILGVYDPDELEAAEPMPERPARAAPVSMRAKLADQSGKQGFDPDHVQAETGAHDPATGEVIEGEAVQAKAPTEQPKTEAQAKDNLAAALASLDAKPKTESPADAALVEALEETGAEVVDVEIVQESPNAEQEAELDGADDLIRQNAYDDGFAGEPIEAVLVMCEDEREEAIARAAFAEGQKNRITKEAEEHAAAEAVQAEKAKAEADAAEAEKAAEAAKEVEANDVAGPAPKGEKYLLATEEPAADGKLTIYQDGAVFSRIVAASAIAKYTRYDGHPEPTDPALATQSGGTATEESKPTEAQPKPEKAAPAPAEMKPNGLYVELAAKESWLQIKPMLTALYGSAPFKALSPEDQAATRAHLFGAVLEMKERTRDPVDWGQDPAAFSLWLDHTAAGNDPDKVAMIEGTFQTLQDGKTFKARLTPEQQNTLAVRVQAVVSKIKAGA